MASLTPVTRSFQKYPATSTPFELHLYITPSEGTTNKWRGWTRGEAISASSMGYRIPLPERNLGASTELAFQDEEAYYASPDLLAAAARKGTEILGEAAAKIDSNLLNLKELVLTLQKGMGGARVPVDLTAISVYGTKKRSYVFNFELFSYETEDGVDIANFVKTIHGESTVTAEPGNYTLRTPSIFTFAIETKGRQDVTDLWYPDPLPCAMTAFQHTPTDFIQTFDGRSSARAICTMQLTEIEPVSYRNGKFGTIWEHFKQNQ